MARNRFFFLPLTAKIKTVYVNSAYVVSFSVTNLLPLIVFQSDQTRLPHHTRHLQ